MNPLAKMTPFGDVDSDIWKCLRCHRIVRLYDANDERERVATLLGHQTFNCVTDPFMGIAFGGSP